MCVPLPFNRFKKEKGKKKKKIPKPPPNKHASSWEVNKSTLLFQNLIIFKVSAVVLSPCQCCSCAQLPYTWFPYLHVGLCTVRKYRSVPLRVQSNCWSGKPLLRKPNLGVKIPPIVAKCMTSEKWFQLWQHTWDFMPMSQTILLIHLS